LAWLAVWLGRVLQRQIDCLKEENRALKEQLGGRKLRLTDATRRRLAVLGKELGRKVLAEVARDAGNNPALVPRAGGKEI
jgi:putative transposase